MLYRHVFDKISTKFRGILRVFVNFVGCRIFTWISQLCNHSKYQKSWLGRRWICLQWWEYTSRCLSTMTNGLCLNDLCGGHYLSQILILLHCRLDRMSKQTTMVHQVFGGYYRSQGKNHGIYFLLVSTLMKIDDWWILERCPIKEN